MASNNAAASDTLQKGMLRLRDDYRLYFKNCLKIRDKTAQIIPFVPNPAQERLINIVEDWKRQYPDERTRPTLRIIILKARQLGFSTATEAIFFHDLHFSFNRVAMIVSFDEDSASTINDMSDRFYQHLPQVIKPARRSSRGKGILFENPQFDPSKEEGPANLPGLQSKFLVETAANTAAGSSYTINYLHLSEIAKWPGDPATTLTSLLQAVPQYGSIVVIESTAKGFNMFRDLWQAAANGESGYIPLFVPWHAHAAYRLPDDGAALTPEEEALAALYHLDREQLAWRRWCIANNCLGNEDIFRQEYPSSPDEAFLTTGRPVFDNAKVIARLEQLRHRRPLAVGRLTYKMNGAGLIDDSSIAFAADPAGPLRLYELPKKGEPYVIGGDTAEGGADYSAASVRNNLTWNQAATWRGHTDTDLFAKQMYCLGKCYGSANGCAADALIGIETNFDSHPIKELQRLDYRNQYLRRRVDTISEKTQDSFGWITTSVSRPILIDDYIALVREDIATVNDERTIQEMLTFVRDERDRPAHMPGEHDDTIFADAIALQIRSQQTTARTVEAPPKFELPWPLRSADDPVHGEERSPATERAQWLWD